MEASTSASCIHWVQGREPDGSLTYSERVPILIPRLEVRVALTALQIAVAAHRYAEQSRGASDGRPSRLRSSRIIWRKAKVTSKRVDRRLLRATARRVWQLSPIADRRRRPTRVPERQARSPSHDLLEGRPTCCSRRGTETGHR